MKIENKEQILQRRKEIEKELSEMLKEIESDFGIDDIKDIIYNEEGQDDLTKAIAMFDRGQGAVELENILDLINDAWNYFPHKILNGLSPAEKMLEYESKTKRKASFKKHQKLTKKQKDLLWSGGGKGPYSQANLIKQVRILNDSVSRIFLVVETEINPTTFEIVKGNRYDDEFKNDIVIQQLLDKAEYRGPRFGYVVAAFEEEYRNNEVLARAEYALKYTQESIIKMHKYVMDNFNN
ncbi:MAG: hypothetical protein AB1643_02460 [Patescibacteria group bacterium]